MYIFVIVFAAILSITFSYYGIKKKIIIEFKFNRFDWIEPIFLSLVFFIAIFFLEYIISLKVNNVLPSDSIWCKLIIKIIENGILAIPLSLLLSAFFEKI